VRPEAEPYVTGVGELRRETRPGVGP
jgi:hypothetical protein